MYNRDRHIRILVCQLLCVSYGRDRCPKRQVLRQCWVEQNLFRFDEALRHTNDRVTASIVD